MVGASKILTVSYGTFSCTLEGFDEPFSTMKAIAEYFRDLAADDRYFGAEPPQPDAEMLHRIAEREIQRRVEAKVQDNGVVLKAGALAAPEGAPVAAPAAAPEAAPAPAVEAPAAKPSPAVAPAAAAAVAASAAPESIAAKLKRIRAAVENARSEAAVAEVPVAEEAEEAENYDDGENAGDLVPAAAMPAVFEDAEEEPAELASEEEASAEAGAEEPAEEEMAAPEMAADETEEEVAQEAAGDDGALAALIQAVSAGHAEEPAEAEVEAEAEAETEAEAEAEETAEAEPAEDLPAPRGTGRVIKVRRIEPVEPGGKTVFETSYDSDEEDAAEAEAPASTLAPEAEAELQAELAEVEREMAAAEGAGAEDLEAEAPEAEAEEIEAAAEEDWQPEAELAEEAEEAEDWAPEDEPELAAEDAGEETVAEVEAEEEDEAEAQGTAAEDEDLFAPVAGTDRSRLTLTDRVDDEAALDRLMRQTANELDEPAAKRRQATLAHLKAAVVATQADKDAGAEAARKEAADLDRYRDDLAHVVRPRRPVAGQAGTARPMTQDRPAPLMLVSEQRVDAPSHSDRVVIRPRRVTSNALAIEEADEMEQIDDTQSIFANSKSFAEFAERIGATELPDLLEAAAAYAACVEGRPHFSRPQILKSAVEAAEMPVSREQSLRSFGMLLRQGKITKVKRGQFAIAETSRYLPEARKIGH